MDVWGDVWGRDVWGLSGVNLSIKYHLNISKATMRIGGIHDMIDRIFFHIHPH